MAAMKIEMTALRTKEGIKLQDRLTPTFLNMHLLPHVRECGELADRIPGLARPVPMSQGLRQNGRSRAGEEIGFAIPKLTKCQAGTKPVILFTDTFNRH